MLSIKKKIIICLIIIIIILLLITIYLLYDNWDKNSKNINENFNVSMPMPIKYISDVKSIAILSAITDEYL